MKDPSLNMGTVIIHAEGKSLHTYCNWNVGGGSGGRWVEARKSQQEGRKVKGPAEGTGGEGWLQWKLGAQKGHQVMPAALLYWTEKRRTRAVQIQLKKRDSKRQGCLAHAGEQEKEVTAQIRPGTQKTQLHGHLHSEAFPWLSLPLCRPLPAAPLAQCTWCFTALIKSYSSDVLSHHIKHSQRVKVVSYSSYS